MNNNIKYLKEDIIKGLETTFNTNFDNSNLVVESYNDKMFGISVRDDKIIIYGYDDDEVEIYDFNSTNPNVLLNHYNMYAKDNNLVFLGTTLLERDGHAFIKSSGAVLESFENNESQFDVFMSEFFLNEEFNNNITNARLNKDYNLFNHLHTAYKMVDYEELYTSMYQQENGIEELLCNHNKSLKRHI